MNKPELLSPAGSPEALAAAIEGGADAVYLGGRLFNARMNAKNFTAEEMKRAADLCHENGVKLYVTLNTQLYDRELKNALAYAAELYGIGVDALITADIGLASLLHTQLPDLPLHASTQMNCHNAGAAAFLSSLGFTRMVANRESTREQLAAMVKDCAPIEIEAFVHGAICVSCSGQCLLSAVMGGRSGNRGECAQPCRMQYNGSNPISMKDMCLAPHVPELGRMGIASLKIEGRMKSPAYVYGVTRIYRRLLDEDRSANAEEMSLLARLFSRGGFTDGYFTGKIGKEMLGIRDASDVGVQTYTPKKEFVPRLARIEPAVREVPKTSVTFPPKAPQTAQPIRTARFRTAKSIPDTDWFDQRYLPLFHFAPGRANGVILPPILFDSEWDEVRRRLEFASRHGAAHLLLTHPGQASLAKEFGLIPHADFRFNVFNTFTARTAAEATGAESVLLSPELILPQARDIDLPAGVRKGMIVYGRYPLMVLTRPVGLTALRDRKNASFPILPEGKLDLLYNSVPVYMADLPDRLAAAGITDHHFIFSDEDPGQILRVIYAYQHRVIPKDPIRRIK